MKIMRLVIAGVFLLLGMVWCALHLQSRVIVAADSEPEAQIRAVLSEQQAAWNRADIAAFMKGYWSSSELTFAGSGGVTRGWQPMLERYRERYRDAQAMGHLDFSELEVHLLGKDAAFVLGRWHLKREKDEPGGVFTQVFQRFPEGWRIVHDHTSADEPRK
jgi:ketosteroid isomerase-like protein